MQKRDEALLFILAAFILASCGGRPALTGHSPKTAYQECRGFADKKDYEEAIECFELLKGRFPGTPEAVDSDLEIAGLYYRQKDYLLAAEAYVTFARIYPTHPRVNEAHYQAGRAYFEETPKAIDRDQQHLEDAVGQFEIVLGNAREEELRSLAEKGWEEARTRQARKHFYVARFYYRTGEYLSAVPRFRTVLSEFTGLGFDEKSLYFLGKSYVKLGQTSEALETLESLERHFPEGKYRHKLANVLKLNY